MLSFILNKVIAAQLRDMRLYNALFKSKLASSVLKAWVKKLGSTCSICLNGTLESSSLRSTWHTLHA